MIKSIYFLLFLTFFNSSSTIEKFWNGNEPNDPMDKAILEKYSQEIGMPVTNVQLYKTIDEWLGVRYRYAGNSKSGVDCSHFVCTVLKEAFGFSDSYYKPSRDLSTEGIEASWKDAKEGDLLCFSINKSSRISHVGIYLGNYKFVHASTSKGVIISSLDDPYYITRLANIRRVKDI